MRKVTRAIGRATQGLILFTAGMVGGGMIFTATHRLDLSVLALAQKAPKMLLAFT